MDYRKSNAPSTTVTGTRHATDTGNIYETVIIVKKAIRFREMKQELNKKLEEFAIYG
jgi:hypothetical protein